MLKEYLSRIANSLRAALGTSEPINAQDFSNKITEVRNIADKKPYLDTSKITDFRNFCEYNRFSYDDIAKLDTSNGTGFYQFLYACRTLTEIPPLDTSKGISFRQMFDTCNALVTIPPIDFSNGTDFFNTFWGCGALKNISFIGTINANINFGYCSSLSVESILNIFNALVDLSSTTSKTLTLGDTNLEKVTETQLAIAINKNWTVN